MKRGILASLLGLLLILAGCNGIQPTRQTSMPQTTPVQKTTSLFLPIGALDISFWEIQTPRNTDTLIVQGVDLLHSSYQNITNLRSVSYSPTYFGNVDNSAAAMEIAAVAFDAVFQTRNCDIKEQPFNVAYNAASQAWVVYGDVKKQNHVAVMVIKTDTAEILFLNHT